MPRRWPSSLCALLCWTGSIACQGTVTSDPSADAAVAYQGDGGWRFEDAGPVGPLDDVAPADCRPDPSEFTACGGEVTGRWRIASICFDSDVEDLREDFMCPQLTQEFAFEYRMRIEFKSSGNYSAVVRAVALHDVLLPFSCVAGEAESDCKAALGEDDTDDSDGLTVLISMNDQGCVIEAREQETSTEAGIWRVSGDKLTMTNALGPRTSEYCVSGDSLIVRNVNSASGKVSWGVFERL